MKKYIDIFKKILGFVPNKNKAIRHMFYASAIGHISSLLPPVATAGIIAMVTQNNVSAIFGYAFLYIIFYVIYFSSRYWRYYTYSEIAQYYHNEVQKKLFEKIADHDAISQKLSKGKLIDTCSDDVRYIVDVIDAFVEATMIIVKLVIIILIFMYYNIFVATFVLVLDLVYLKLMDINSRKVAKHYEGTRKYNDKLIDMLNQMMTNVKQVKTLNMMPGLNKKLDRFRNKWTSQYIQRRQNMTYRYSTIPAIVYFGKIMLYVILGLLVINKVMTLDKLVLLISYFEMTITCTDEMLNHLLNLSNYNVQMNRIKTILDYTPKKELDYGTFNNDYINGTVVFKNVTYENKGEKILKNVSFKIYPNEINAIIGHSGSGKSTVLNLIYRLRRINNGSILIDNQDIYDYSTSVFSSNVSGVFQNSFVFQMSIKDNLGLIDPDPINQMEACKRVGIHDYIMKLPQGYNTVIGEDEHNFTAGQKQLLAIARSLLSKAEILLFDEVTSNIDPKSTSDIANVLLDLKSDHTVVMVTHKPEMMEIADRIVLLNNGKVSDKGTNKAVYERSSLYRELKNRTFASVSRLED